jgi:ureidoacrylate peracid hydrolase
LTDATTPEPTDGFSSKMVESPILPLPTSQTAVLIVDMVNDYLDPTGAMPVDDPTAVLDGVEALVDLARAEGALVVWVRPGHTEQSDGLFRKRIPHAIGDSTGAEIHPRFEVGASERVVRKRRYSGFFQTDLDLYLREHGIRRVVVAGVALNICVRSTVHDAFFNGYDVWVPPEACEATGPREAESTLYDIQTHFGEVLSLDRIRELWTDAPAPSSESH